MNLRVRIGAKRNAHVASLTWVSFLFSFARSIVSNRGTMILQREVAMLGLRCLTVRCFLKSKDFNVSGVNSGTEIGNTSSVLGSTPLSVLLSSMEESWSVIGLLWFPVQ